MVQIWTKLLFKSRFEAIAAVVCWTNIHWNVHLDICCCCCSSKTHILQDCFSFVSGLNWRCRDRLHGKCSSYELYLPFFRCPGFPVHNLVVAIKHSMKVKSVTVTECNALKDTKAKCLFNSFHFLLASYVKVFFSSCLNMF